MMSEEGDDSRKKRYCCIKSCKYYKGTLDSSVCFFRAPLISNPLRIEWEKCLTSNIGTKAYSIMNLLCQLHFKPEDLVMCRIYGVNRYKLKQGALPLVIEKPKEERTDLDDQSIQYIKTVNIEHIKSGAYNVNERKTKPTPEKADKHRSTYTDKPAKSSICNECIQYDIKLQIANIKIKELTTENRKLRGEVKKMQARLSLSTSRQASNIGDDELLLQSYNYQFKECTLCCKHLSKSDFHQHLCLENEDSIKCSYCSKSFDTTVIFLTHLDVHDAEIKADQKKVFLKCDKCPMAFTMPILLKCHEISHVNDEMEHVITVKDDDLDESDSIVKSETIFEPISIHDLELLKIPITCTVKQEEQSAQTANGFAPVQAVQPVPSHSREKIGKFFKCGICLEQFDTGRELSRHIMAHEADHNIVEMDTGFECYLCKHKSKMEKELRKHMQQHKRNKKCEICFTPLTSSELKSHLCGLEKSIDCEYCAKRFYVTQKLLRHVENAHATTKRLHRCDKCPKFFSMTILRDQHQVYHIDVPKPFMCDICPKTFATKYSLKTHGRMHKSERSFLCDLCGKGFQTERNLKIHKLYHSEPTIQCPECPKKFFQAGELKQHIASVHRNYKYVCEICGNEFTSYYEHMKRHRRTDADRKFECEICSMKFFDAKTLKLHLRVHTSEKEFRCRFCSQSYKYCGDLNKHLKTHMDGKIYECPKCPMRFQYPKELRKHSFEHYKEEKANDLNKDSTN